MTMELLSALVLVAAVQGQGGQSPANALFTDLTEKGIAIPNGPVVKLPTPLVSQEVDAATAPALLEKAAGKLPPELFVRKSDAAPFNLKIDSINDKKGERCAQTIDLWLIAYGKLTTVAQKDVVTQLLVGERDRDHAEIKLLSVDELRARGITPLQGPGLEERYATFEAVLLDKVQVTGITRNVKTIAPRSLVLAMTLDDRFANDKEHPNRWRPIGPGVDGKVKLGAPQPYAGLAGYVRVSELPRPPGALLFEMHCVFHEPPAWFGGPNLLRSKLPVVIQENLRTFRRKLARD
jgi:hypothetical protein